MNSKNKFSAFMTRNWKYKGHEILDGGQEGFHSGRSVGDLHTAQQMADVLYHRKRKWTGTLTPRLITEVGMSISHLDYNDLYQPGLDQVPNSPQAGTPTRRPETLAPLRRYLRARGAISISRPRGTSSAELRPTSPAHTRSGSAFRTALGRTTERQRERRRVHAVHQRRPDQFRRLITRRTYQCPNLDADIGIFATDTWHFKRFAITAGIRWEYLVGRDSGHETLPPADSLRPRTVSNAIDCNTIKGMGCWNDWAPRLELVYDVFGNHKLAVKAGFGKYNSPYSTGFTNNFNPMSGVTVQRWPGTCLPAPLIPGRTVRPGYVQGSVPAPNPNCFPTGGFNGVGALPGVGAGTLGPSWNPAFGSVAAGTGVGLDPNWHRDYNYQYNAGIQQEIFQGVTLNCELVPAFAVSADAGLENYAVGPDAWTPVTITNPLDGSPITVCAT